MHCIHRKKWGVERNTGSFGQKKGAPVSGNPTEVMNEADLPLCGVFAAFGSFSFCFALMLFHQLYNVVPLCHFVERH